MSSIAMGLHKIVNSMVHALKQIKNPRNEILNWKAIKGYLIHESTVTEWVKYKLEGEEGGKSFAWSYQTFFYHLFIFRINIPIGLSFYFFGIRVYEIVFSIRRHRTTGTELTSTFFKFFFYYSREKKVFHYLSKCKGVLP